MGKKRIPEVGEKVHMFDDGKIRNCRHMTGEVVRVIPFEEFQKEFADYGRTENLFWMSSLKGNMLSMEDIHSF